MTPPKLLPLLLLALPACDNTAAQSVDYTPLLATLTDQIAVPSVTAFSQSADALVPAMMALETTPTADTLATAQAAWRQARASWRKLDALSFGPAAIDGINERIDSSPKDPPTEMANHAAIDTQVNGTATLDATLVADLGDGSKGFLGIEYLIFSSSGASVALQSLTGDGVPSRRRTLARLMTEELDAAGQQLATDWGPYAMELKTAGHGSTTFTHQTDALTQFVEGAVNGLELVVATRLGLPLGHKNDGVPLPSADPTTASDSAVADMTNTLAGVNTVWAAPGLSTQVMASALTSEANTDQSDCKAAVTAIPTPFAMAMTSQLPDVQNAYNACKVWKGLWYTDLANAVGSNGLLLDGDGD